MFCAKKLHGVGLSDLRFGISWGCLPGHQDPDSSSPLFFDILLGGEKISEIYGRFYLEMWGKFTA